MNKAIGNECEKRYMEMLTKAGFWCHLFAYKSEGQPCDVVALRDGKGMLADVKHCSSNRFPFSDVQPNQITCFRLAKSKGNDWIGFAIYFEVDGSWRWMAFDDFERMRNEGAKSVKPDELEMLRY